MWIIIDFELLSLNMELYVYWKVIVWNSLLVIMSVSFWKETAVFTLLFRRSILYN